MDRGVSVRAVAGSIDDVKAVLGSGWIGLVVDRVEGRERRALRRGSLRLPLGVGLGGAVVVRRRLRRCSGAKASRGGVRRCGRDCRFAFE